MSPPEPHFLCSLFTCFRDYRFDDCSWHLFTAVTAAAAAAAAEFTHPSAPFHSSVLRIKENENGRRTHENADDPEEEAVEDTHQVLPVVAVVPLAPLVPGRAVCGGGGGGGGGCTVVGSRSRVEVKSVELFEDLLSLLRSVGRGSVGGDGGVPAGESDAGQVEEETVDVVGMAAVGPRPVARSSLEERLYVVESLIGSPDTQDFGQVEQDEAPDPSTRLFLRFSVVNVKNENRHADGDRSKDHSRHQIDNYKQ